MKEPKGSQNLIKWLKYAFYRWNKNKNRYSWLWCPVCDYDLNGDNDSFLKESKDLMYWFYKCKRCGCKSKWHLFTMMPMVDKHQKFKKNKKNIEKIKQKE